MGIWKFGDRVRGIIWGFDEEGSHGSHSPGFRGVARFRGFRGGDLAGSHGG